MTRPYIGLRYFEERDAHLFYGRDEHVAELLAKVADNRFVAVMGSSGCGKSSLVRAGLLPELRSGMIPKAGPRWKVVEFKPGRAPLHELADAIRLELGVGNARELVEEGPLGIARAVGKGKLDEGTNVLLIADQFEEVFRFQREEQSQGRGAQAAEDCQSLARRLLDAAEYPDLPIYVLVVMRSDYLGECARFPDLPERMSQSLYLVPRPRRDQLQEAIMAPVGGAIEPAVVQRLLGEVGSDPDQLPRLQHLLGRMWDRAAGGRLTMAHYDACGGWEQGLEQHLEQVYSDLSEPRQAVCSQVFLQLSELDKGRAVRRGAEMAELIEVCGAQAADVVKAFRAAGFLTPRESPVDITHECILREWPRLRGWLEREQLNARRLRELAEAAQDAGWRPGLTPEQERPVRGLAGLTLLNLVGWRNESRPTAAWARRYLTAVDFQTANGYLTWSEQRDKEQRRRARRRTQILSGALGLLLMGLGVAAWWLYQLTGTLRLSGLPAYAAASQVDDPARALYLGWHAAQRKRPLPLGLEEVLATALGRGASYGVLRGHTAEVTAVAWSPDGKTLASSSKDGTVRLWDAASGQASRILRHTGAVAAIAWSPDGTRLASGGDDGTIRIWTPDGQTLAGLPARHKVVSLAWNPDGKTLAAAIAVLMNKTVQLWDVPSGQLRDTLGDMQTGVNSVAWSPDGKTLAAGGPNVGGGRLLLYDSTGKETNAKQFTGNVNSVAWSPDGKIVAASIGLTTETWDFALNRGDLFQSGGNVYSVGWSPDGTILSSAGDSRTIDLWGAHGEHLRSLNGHQGRVTGVAWNRDGIFASASDDQTIRLWDAESGQPLRTLRGDLKSVACISWRSDGKTLVSSSGSVDPNRLWDVMSGKQIPAMQPQHGSASYSVAFSPDGKTIASAYENGMIWLWEPGGGQQPRPLAGHQDLVFDVAWSPDGTTLASTSRDGTIRLWDAAGGQLPRVFKSGGNQADNISWSPDGKTLAFGNAVGVIWLWSVAVGGDSRSFSIGSNPSVRSVAWSPDGARIASGADDKSLRLWDAGTGKPLRAIEATSTVNSVVWSPNGTLASAGEDGTIQLWDTNGQLLRTLRGHTSGVYRVAWSPDGKTLASASGDGTIRLWPGTVDALLDQVRDRIRLFSLSKDECQKYFGSNSCLPVH